MQREETFHQIESYLAGELSAADHAAFERRLQQEPEFQKTVQLHRQVAEANRGEGFQQFRSVLNETNASWQMPGAAHSPKNARVIGISFFRKVAAIAAMVIFGLACWWIFFPPQPNATELFAQHFEPYDMVLSQRSAENPSQDLETAVNAYVQGDYPLAEATFRSLAETDPDLVIYQMYECVSQLADGRSAAAVDCFQRLRQLPNYQEQASWYLGLAYLQQQQIDAARQTFAAIPEGAYQYERARKILRQLPAR